MSPFFHFRASISSEEIFQVAQQRATALRDRSVTELARLPASQDEMVPLKEHQIAVCTWRDTLTDGSVRIVVQAHLRGFGIGWMAADGFIVAPDGTQSPVPEEMMWEFL